MANLERRGTRWRARVFVHGHRESATFATKAQAAAWALEREAQLTGAKAYQGRLAEAFERYAREVAPSHRGWRHELMRLKHMQADPVGRCSLSSLSAADIAAYRDRRLQRVSGASVKRELNLFGAVLETARREWGWLRINPMRDVRKPVSPPSRKRRISDEEIRRLTLAFGLGGGLVAETAMQRTGLAFLFALETAMRAGEITAMQAPDIDLAHRFVRLPRTKNGDVREVPLSTQAITILNTLPNATPVFGLEPPTRDVMFRRARAAAGISDLHFHDSRSEAIWRLSKKFDVLELARVIGHRDLKSLMLYFNASAAELAMRLD